MLFDVTICTMENGEAVETTTQWREGIKEPVHAGMFENAVWVRVTPRT